MERLPARPGLTRIGRAGRLAVGLSLAAVAAHARAVDAPAASLATASAPTAQEARRDNDLAQAAFYRERARAPDPDKAPWWSPLVVGAVLTLGGSLATLLAGDRIAAAKVQHERRRLYGRQKLQVGLAVRALIESLVRIDADGAGGPARFLSRDLLLAQPPQPQAFDRQAAYYLKYDLVSTVYRLCALLGWMELYRTDPEFMSSVADERARFEAGFSRVRTLLGGDAASIAADETAAASSGFTPARDGIVLADDQRAIGEKMLTRPDDKAPRAVVGYACFAESLFRFPGRFGPIQDPGEGDHADLPQDHWIWNATSFFVGIGDSATPDLRLWRLRQLCETLRGLLPVLLPAELQNGLATADAGGAGVGR